MRCTSTPVPHRLHLAALLAVAATIAAPITTQAQVKSIAQGAWGGKTNGVGHYADVNGITLYYEMHGTGRPLILLHGGLGAIEMFGPNLSALAKGRQVIASGAPDSILKSSLSSNRRRSRGDETDADV